MADELGMPEQFEQTPVTVEEQKQPEQAQEQTQKEQNWRLMRDRMEAAERRAQELERIMQMNMNQQQTTKLQVVDEDDDFDISDDTYIEGKHLKKYVKTLKKELKETKQQFQKYSQESAVSNAEMRLKTQFPDFDKVVSSANIEKLKHEKPALFRSIMANPDIYDQGYTAYEMIKNSVQVDPYASEEKRLEENRVKPRSSATAAPQANESALARVGDYDRRILTEARKNELLKQVHDAKQLR